MYNYNKKLKEKNIEIEPLEEYQGSKTKIKHKCICGNIWEVSPNKVLMGRKCGCTRRSSHDKYLALLTTKNIKVIPIEKYKTKNSKIKHKCICGNEWRTTPQTVLSGSTCGCSRVDSNEKYLKILNERNIEVIPLEPYINDKTKIKHKCTCGNEWLAAPCTVKNKTKCGCREELKGETILYYIKIKGIYKIGITYFNKKYKTIENNIMKRYTRTKEKDYIDIISTRLFDSRIKALKREKEILNKYKDFKYNGEKKIVKGNTELFSEDIGVQL